LAFFDDDDDDDDVGHELVGSTLQLFFFLQLDM
jgi:hypothetical protein